MKLRANGRNIVGEQLPTLRPFARSLKGPVKCGLSEMNNVIGMKNLRKTVFLDLDISVVFRRIFRFE